MRAEPSCPAAPFDDQRTGCMYSPMNARTTGKFSGVHWRRKPAHSVPRRSMTLARSTTSTCITCPQLIENRKSPESTVVSPRNRNSAPSLEILSTWIPASKPHQIPLQRPPDVARDRSSARSATATPAGGLPAKISAPRASTTNCARHELVPSVIGRRGLARASHRTTPAPTSASDTSQSIPPNPITSESSKTRKPQVRVATSAPPIRNPLF